MKNRSGLIVAEERILIANYWSVFTVGNIIIVPWKYGIISFFLSL